MALMRKLLFFVFQLIITASVFATHQRAGEITYKWVSGFNYEFTVITYTFTPSPADRPELRIDWGDGVSSVIQRTDIIQLPNNITRNEYKGAQHIFPGQGTYTISVEDPNRNYGVLNIPNSVNVPFYIQTELVINPFLGPNNSVQLLSPPVDIGCVNTIYLHNPVAYDTDGDSLSFKLVSCRGASGLPIPGYVLPNQIDPSGESTFEMDPVNGTITWDKPALQGEYNIAFIVEEWRYGVRIGYVTRDMQINIIACNNQPPQLAAVFDTCVMAGDSLMFNVSATDPDNDWLVIRALGGPFILDENPAVFPPAFGQGEVSSTFFWVPVCEHVRLQPYQVVFFAKDSLTFPQLVDIKSVNIQVISPPPENLSATPVGNTIHLSWNKAICSRTSGYELYRRSGFYGFMPDACETGVPQYTGYQKIATMESSNDTTFIDNNNNAGLIRGINYCYMVVATFPDGAESYASAEACASLKKDVPIITNVSVEFTDLNNGEVFVAWSKPTELDTILFPPPYTYLINRTTTENPDIFFRIDSTTNINDTLFIDKDLNTKELTYIYKIEFYSRLIPNRSYVGSTQTARSIFLNIYETDKRLELSWNADVPWQNDYYVIYRLNTETFEYDSIDFSLLPAYDDLNLQNGLEYSYFIKSVGKYSASGMIRPIINFSQITSGIPVDNIPPCPQILEVNTDCDRTENNLSWENPPFCPEDIEKYYIYYSPTAGDDLNIIDSIQNPYATEYQHTDLSSIAGCYAVVALDSVGNQSDFSNIICVDISICGTYSLPNVFTPNNDDINDRFKAFQFTSVERINLTIFNRWGRVVYETNDPWFEWDGKNMNNNRDCVEGVYFYICEVFEIQLEGLTTRTLTGSITLLR